jgi:hypothetical protein
MIATLKLSCNVSCKIPFFFIVQMKEVYKLFLKNSLNNKGQRFFPILVDKFFFNCKHNNKKL